MIRNRTPLASRSSPKYQSVTGVDDMRYPPALNHHMLTDALVFIVATLILLWPIAVNKTPLLYPDTIAYLQNGARIFSIVEKHVLHVNARAAVPHEKSLLLGDQFYMKRPAASDAPVEARFAITGSRSFYYGAFAWFCRLVGGWFFIAIVQAAWCAIALILAFARFGLANPTNQILAIIILSLGSTVALYTVIILPDLFAGLTTLAIFIIVNDTKRTFSGRSIFWSITLLFGILTHKAFLLSSVCTLALSVIACRSRAHFRWFGSGIALTLIVISVLMTFVVSPIASRVGLMIIDPPFLLARVVGDGTAKVVLERDCTKAHYVTCKILPFLPMTENQFLWDNANLSWQRVNTHQRLAINSEQYKIVYGVLVSVPIAQARRTLDNISRQLFDLDLDEFVDQPFVQGEMLRVGLFAEMHEYNLSRIRLHQFPLRALASFWTGLYIGGVLFILLLIAFNRFTRLLSFDMCAAAIVLIGSCLISAIITGSIAGVYGRYQGRISWLALFLVIVIVNYLRNQFTVQKRALDRLPVVSA